MNKKYLIGIDGGGTKTFGILWDDNNNKIKEYTSGFSNFNVNHDKAKKNLEEVISNLLIEISGEIEIVIGLSGLTGLREKRKYTNELEEKYKAKVSFYTDAELSMAALLENNNHPGIIIISGTGSILIGKKDNQIYSVGGFGHLIGDQGSSYHVVIEAIKYIIKQTEEQRQINDFIKTMYKVFEVKNLEELKKLVYHNSKSQIASYSKTIDDLANNGDEVAKELLLNEAELLINQFNNMYKMMEIKSKVEVGLIGSFINNSQIVNNKFCQEVTNKGIIIKNIINPVNGAKYLKKRY